MNHIGISEEITYVDYVHLPNIQPLGDYGQDFEHNATEVVWFGLPREVGKRSILEKRKKEIKKHVYCFIK